MLLDEKRGVAGGGIEGGREPGHFEEVSHPDREVRSVHERAAPRAEGLRHPRELPVPAGRAAHDGGSRPGEPEQVARRGGGVRELEHDVGGGQELGRQPRSSRVFARPERPDDVVSATRRGGFDLTAHLSRSDDAEAHGRESIRFPNTLEYGPSTGRMRI